MIQAFITNATEELLTFLNGLTVNINVTTQKPMIERVINLLNELQSNQTYTWGLPPGAQELLTHLQQLIR